MALLNRPKRLTGAVEQTGVEGRVSRRCALSAPSRFGKGVTRAPVYLWCRWVWIPCGKGIYCTLLGGMYVGLAHVILHIYDLKVVTVWLPDLFRPSGFFVLDQKPPYLSEYHEISKFEISPPTDSQSTLSFSLGHIHARGSRWG